MMHRRTTSPNRFGVFSLLVLAILLQLSGLQLDLHEAHEQDCANPGNGMCILCLGPAAAVAVPLAAEPVGTPTLVPAHDLCVTGDHQPPLDPDLQPASGRSPPTVLPA